MEKGKEGIRNEGKSKPAQSVKEKSETWSVPCHALGSLRHPNPVCPSFEFQG